MAKKKPSTTPKKTTHVVRSPEQRAQACKAKIDRALAEDGCELVSATEIVGSTVTSSVKLVAKP